MSKSYTQLSLEQRYQIQAFLKAGMKQNWIAQEIGVHPSTISRELNRNIAQRGRTAGAYVATNAQRKTEQRHQRKPKFVKFTRAMKEHAVQWLTHEKWSPEIISVVGHRTGKCLVSVEWLYQWIWDSKHGNKRVNKRYNVFTRCLNMGNVEENEGPERIAGVSLMIVYLLINDLRLFKSAFALVILK